MRKIICYGRGCNNQAQWTTTRGSHRWYLCTKCMQRLARDVVPERLDHGPSEYKMEEEDREEKQAVL